MCHTAPTAQKYGFPPDTHGAFSLPGAARTPREYASRKIVPAVLKPQKSPRWALKQGQHLEILVLKARNFFGP